MSQAPFPCASLLTEGLIEERLGNKQTSAAPTDAERAQPDVQREPAINIQSDLPHSQTEAIAIKESPHTGTDTRGDAGPVPLDITSETNLLEQSTSTGSGKPKASYEGPRLSKSDGWTTATSGETDDETLNWLEKELAKQTLDKDPSKSKEVPVKKQKQAGWPLSSGAEERPPQKLISSGPDEVVVHRGFGDFPLPRSAALDERRTSFPPLSNASYDLTTYGLDPKVRKKSSIGIVVDENNAPVASADPTGTDGESHTLDGNLSGPSSVHSNGAVIKKIGPSSFHSNGAVIKKIGPSSFHSNGAVIKKIGPSSFHSNDAVVESAAANGAATQNVVSSDNLEFCTKCQKRHIKQGPPVTLDDRDTCRSMLPDWFPKERYEKPWEVFTDLINKYVRASQMLDGTEENSETKAPWNMEYHDPSPEWKEAGRFGGWWKCRIEDERGESEVSTAEKNCKICLRRKVENDRLPIKRVETLMEKKQSIEDWIDKHMKEEMVKDRAYVKARLETEGF